MAEALIGRGIVEVLEARGLDTTAMIKLVRHRDARPEYEIGRLQRQGWLEEYQSIQSRPVFDAVDKIVTFIGLPGKTGQFWGVYAVLGRQSADKWQVPIAFPFPEWKRPDWYYYELHKEPGYDDLRNVLVDWGEGARAWHQWMRKRDGVDKKIIGVLA